MKSARASLEDFKDLSDGLGASVQGRLWGRNIQYPL